MARDRSYSSSSWTDPNAIPYSATEQTNHLACSFGGPTSTLTPANEQRPWQEDPGSVQPGKRVPRASYVICFEKGRSGKRPLKSVTLHEARCRGNAQCILMLPDLTRLRGEQVARQTAMSSGKADGLVGAPRGVLRHHGYEFFGP